MALGLTFGRPERAGGRPRRALRSDACVGTLPGRPIVPAGHGVVSWHFFDMVEDRQLTLHLTITCSISIRFGNPNCQATPSVLDTSIPEVMGWIMGMPGKQKGRSEKTGPELHFVGGRGRI